jgi:uridine phosphorylase
LSGDLPITGVPREGLPKLALVTGDPKRVPRIAEMLDGCREIADRREYVTCTGAWKGTELVVASHGVGAPGAVLLFHELAQAGVTTMVRAGTCGALDESISDGDLIVATGAVREDGVTDQMVPSSHPASSNPEVVMALQGAAERLEHPVHQGTVLTSALFFPGLLGSTQAKHAADGVIAVEMELAALLVIASLKGLRAGGVLVVDGAPLNATPEAYDPHRTVVQDGVRAMFTVALDALHELAS